MKSPRRIALDNCAHKEMIQLSTAIPPQNSLFWTMWNACTTIAQQALNTGFIQGISTGTLNPDQYGGFNVNDAYYCFNGANDYLLAANRATDPALKQFLLAKSVSYQKYNQIFPAVWRVQPQSVIPFSACVQYSLFETQVAQNEEPIYSLIVMLPCEFLWYWLASQLPAPAQGNVYASWITDNNDPSGAYKMGNFLDSYQQANPGVIDTQKALQFYSQAMGYEVQNFAAAT